MLTNECLPCYEYYYSVGGTNSCLSCASGGHSSAGSSSCEQCLTGKFFDPIAVRCLNCPKGKYSENGAADSSGCIDCLVGFIAGEGKGYCSPCPQYEKMDHDDATSCVCENSFVRDPTKGNACTCGPGKMLIGTVCESCEVGKFKDFLGISSCELCDQNILFSTTLFVGAKSPDDCVCPESTYLDEKRTNCIYVDSTAGVMLGVSSMTIDNLDLKPGYWRISNSTTDVRKCPVEIACQGGNSTAGYCREGHVGPYCNLCKKDYSKNVFQLCDSCSVFSKKPYATVLSFLGLVALIWVVWYVLNRLLKGRKKLRKSLKSTLRIVFVTYQILATLPSIVPAMELPENFKAFLSSIQFVTANIFQFVNIGCVAESFNFYLMLLSVTLIPLALMMALFLLGRFKRSFRDTCYALALALSFIILPGVSTLVFRAFPCDPFDDERTFLRADYGISCNTKTYTFFKFYAGVMVFIYPIGIPVTYAIALFKARKNIQNPVEIRDADEAVASLAFLFDSYKPKFWWFEIFETVRRLSLTGALGALMPGTVTQMTVGVLLCVGGLVVYCVARPFLSARDNLLGILSK